MRYIYRYRSYDLILGNKDTRIPTKVQYNTTIPKIIMFDFPRNIDVKQMNQSTCLMETVKSGLIETNFGGHHKQVAISNIHLVVFSNQVPDLSILSKDRCFNQRL